jgi:hypothetical protein
VNRYTGGRGVGGCREKEVRTSEEGKGRYEKNAKDGKVRRG